ncbi:MAG: hydrogenase maturation nickel metallochaperone HypA [Planctomycetaceae bacterium]|jgi:hydrogenase nickel incorporation protein HypA/HybF|nr:hydrogenase maturation nickel metallochaperone HypA [Planctomycetaceae bacterium]
MHEASLVRALLTQVGKLLTGHNGATVEVVRVEIGPLSGVEPTLVEIAFQQQVDATPCCGATLKIKEVPLTAVCRDCSNEFNIESFRFQCIACGSNQVRITHGDEFRLLDVELRTASPVTTQPN